MSNKKKSKVKTRKIRVLLKEYRLPRIYNKKKRHLNRPKETTSS